MKKQWKRGVKCMSEINSGTAEFVERLYTLFDSHDENSEEYKKLKAKWGHMVDLSDAPAGTYNVYEIREYSLGVPMPPAKPKVKTSKPTHNTYANRKG
jgi:hypothetical protein